MSDRKNNMNYVGIDRFRLAAAVLVIAIHTSPLLTYSKTGDIILAGILARTAVPFFFMATGFFLFQKKDEMFSYKRFFLKNIRLYAAAILLFLPLSIYAGYFNQSPFFPALLKDLVFNGTFYHLWYFPAIILGTGITLLLLRLMPLKAALPAAFALYLIGLFGDSYYGFSSRIPLLKGVYDILFQCFDYTRNGLFFAPLYLMMGILLAKRKTLPRRHCTLGLGFSLVLMLTEGLLLHFYSQPRHDSMYLSLVFCMYFLFQLLLHCKGSAVRGLRRISLLIYLIHPWCIVLIRGFAKAVNVQDILVHNSVIFFLTVTALSVTISVSANWLWNLRNSKLPEGNCPNYLKASLLTEEAAPDQRSRAWAEINLSNLRSNLEQIKQLLPEGCEVMAVVKADAYGHGAVPISRELQVCGVRAFAVATIDEGIQLRKSGIEGTILVLGYTHPQNAGFLIKYQLIQTAVDHGHAVALNDAASQIGEAAGRSNEAAGRIGAGNKIRIHLKIDTGMHRLGEAFNHIEEIAATFRMPNLSIEGMFTHLCVSDSAHVEDVAYTKRQIENFYRAADEIKNLGYTIPALHIQSSYGVLNYPGLPCSFARIGISLYGALSQENHELKAMTALQPVMAIKARIAAIRELDAGSEVGYGRQFMSEAPMRIAVITIGYADGIPRDLKGGLVLIGGKPAPVIGRICMDQLTVDVSDIPEAKQGGIVTILGRDGDVEIAPEQLAEKACTITNELFSRLGGRLARIYISK